MLASRFGMPQLIQPGGGAETAVEHHHVPPGRIIGKGSCLATTGQRGIGGIQFLRRIEDLFVAASLSRDGDGLQCGFQHLNDIHIAHGRTSEEVAILVTHDQGRILGIL